MHTSLFIAGRYLFSRKKRNAINIISGIAVLAFAVCTAALIIILSTMNGFENLIVSMYNKFNPDYKITAAEGKVFPSSELAARIGKLEGVLYCWPVLEDNAAIRNGDYQTVCTVKGVDSAYLQNNGLLSHITEGEGVLQSGAYRFMVLGAGIDQKINCNIGGPFSRVSLITPSRKEHSISDADAVREMQIEPAGTIALDETISNRYVFVPLDFARELFERSDEVSALEIRLKDGADAKGFERQVSAILGKAYKLQNRYQQQATLYRMFKSEKWASYSILSFVLLIAAFNALGSLTMLVMEKKDDIKTLISLGARPRMPGRIFLFSGLMISGLGTLLGILFGVGLVWLQQEFGLVKMTGAIVENYPVKLLFSDVLLVAFTGLGLGFLSGLYPAGRARAFK